MFEKKLNYPNKTTLNLVIKDRPPNYYRKILLGLLIGVIVIGVFAKFAVIDRLSAANRLEAQAAADRQHYEQLVADNAVLVEVRAEYEKYFTNVHSIAYADCMEVMKLIERNLMTSAGVQSFTLQNNSIAVVLTGIDLEQASSIVRALYSSDMVESVSVSSADTTAAAGETSSVSMSIVLSVEGGAAK